MAFDIYHTAVNIDGDGFELALSQELSKEFEIDFPFIDQGNILSYRNSFPQDFIMLSGVAVISFTQWVNA
jgi:hypothetical protein